MAPGEPTIEDPVGTPVKRGWDLAAELWDRTGPDHPAVLIQQIIMGGREAVVVASRFGADLPVRQMVSGVRSALAVHYQWQHDARCGAPLSV